LARHYVCLIRFLADIAALLGLVVGGAVAGFARPAFLLKRRWIPIALAAALLGALGWLILVLSEEDEYYGDGTTVWEHAHRTGVWVFVLIAAAAVAATIVALVWRDRRAALASD
jgi:H+/Cl- antiporter ClcA